MEQLRVLYERNRQALLCINNGDSDNGIQIIKRMEPIAKKMKINHPQLKNKLNSLQIISLNNLACAYMKKNQLTTSLLSLQQARRLQTILCNDKETSDNLQFLHQIATTSSNLCAVFSKMGEHQKALTQITNAIEILSEFDQKQVSDALCIFYFNCASQLQYLNRFNKAKAVLQKGFLFSKQNKYMLDKFRQSLVILNQKISQRQKKVRRSLSLRKDQHNPSYNSEVTIRKKNNSFNKTHKNVRKDSDLIEDNTINSRENNNNESKIPLRKSKIGVLQLPITLENQQNSKNIKLQNNLNRHKAISLYEQKVKKMILNDKKQSKIKIQ